MQNFIRILLASVALLPVISHEVVAAAGQVINNGPCDNCGAVVWRGYVDDNSYGGDAYIYVGRDESTYKPVLTYTVAKKNINETFELTMGGFRNSNGETMMDYLDGHGFYNNLFNMEAGKTVVAAIQSATTVMTGATWTRGSNGQLMIRETYTIKDKNGKIAAQGVQVFSPKPDITDGYPMLYEGTALPFVIPPKEILDKYRGSISIDPENPTSVRFDGGGTWGGGTADLDKYTQFSLFIAGEVTKAQVKTMQTADGTMYYYTPNMIGVNTDSKTGLPTTVTVGYKSIPVASLSDAEKVKIATSQGMTYNTNTQTFVYNVTSAERGPDGYTIKGRDGSPLVVSASMLPKDVVSAANTAFNEKVAKLPETVWVTDGVHVGTYDPTTGTININGKPYTGAVFDASSGEYIAGTSIFKPAGPDNTYVVYNVNGQQINGATIKLVDGKPVAVKNGQVLDGVSFVPQSVDGGTLEYNPQSKQYTMTYTDGRSPKLLQMTDSGMLGLHPTQITIDARNMAKEEGYKTQVANFKDQVGNVQSILTWGMVTGEDGKQRWLDKKERTDIAKFINAGNAEALGKYLTDHNINLSQDDRARLITAAETKGSINTDFAGVPQKPGDVPDIKIDHGNTDLEKNRTAMIRNTAIVENKELPLKDRIAASTAAFQAMQALNAMGGDATHGFGTDSMTDAARSAAYFNTNGIFDTNALDSHSQVLWDTLKYSGISDDKYPALGTYYGLNDANRAAAGDVDPGKSGFYYDASPDGKFSKQLDNLGLMVEVVNVGGHTVSLIKVNPASKNVELGMALSNFATSWQNYNEAKAKVSQTYGGKVAAAEAAMNKAKAELDKQKKGTDAYNKAKAAYDAAQQDYNDTKKKVDDARAAYLANPNETTRAAYEQAAGGSLAAAQDRYNAAKKALDGAKKGTDEYKRAEAEMKAASDAMKANEENAAAALIAEDNALRDLKQAYAEKAEVGRNGAKQDLTDGKVWGNGENGTFTPLDNEGKPITDPQQVTGANVVYNGIMSNTPEGEAIRNAILNHGEGPYTADDFKGLPPADADAAAAYLNSLNKDQQDALRNAADKTSNAFTEGPNGEKLPDQSTLEANMEISKKTDIPHEAKVADLVQLVLETLTTKKTDNEFDETKNVEIAAGDIGEAVGPVEPTALANPDSVGLTGRITSAATYASALLKMGAVDLNNLSESVAKEEEETGPKLGTGSGLGTEGQGTGNTGSTTTQTTHVDSEYVKEIRRRREELLRQTVNRTIQLSEGMNAISKDFFERAKGFTDDLKPVLTQNGSLGGNQDVSRFILLETLRGAALTGAQMSIQGARILSEQEVVDETSSENN